MSVARQTKRCARCRRDFDLIFFTLNRKVKYRSADQYRRAICKGCDQLLRDRNKHQNPFLSKAYSAIRDHAHRLSHTVEEMRNKFGWNPCDIAHQMEHAYGNGCLVCHRLYASMGHGLGDLTIDIVDPSREPYWCSGNVRLICNTCNQEKRDMDPIDYAIYRAEWERFETEPIPNDPQIDMFDLPPEARQRQQWREFTRAPCQCEQQSEQMFLI
jgi:hypothetical protein